MRAETYSSSGENAQPATTNYLPVTSFDTKKPVSKRPWYRVRDPLLRECIAEVLGTFVMMAFINGVVAQVVLGEGKNGDYTHISIGCGLAVTFGIHAAGGVSGAHLNPSVSFALCVYGIMPWRKWPFYMLSQMLGAFLGALFVFIIYLPAINVYDGDRVWNKTGGIFATYPQSYENHGSAFVCEMLGTFMLLLTIMSMEQAQACSASRSSVSLLLMLTRYKFNLADANLNVLAARLSPIVADADLERPKAPAKSMKAPEIALQQDTKKLTKHITIPTRKSALTLNK
ncbi:hypothetical protein SPRG_22346 [Saprolegnia parasitica CBS 223.65]|uniref:Aquaporin n=1 Tax=Saprolegnia parasitica (strain CBS 223.65) TaxID=695850 RepID=A0A067BNE4_SAPPC|nr:hypothetical protein SPRG_22346 [Saprolegnia parasitica CBS 223.65]KDO19748.1 hypothetical protein SPRG_22346 [Saprolegnia parasitica CBS 223.65]|eukprot:XP_012209562.1 hypothetical protein SPRG_22346 [Saprolegnia parasitica CBS 223.65]